MLLIAACGADEPPPPPPQHEPEPEAPALRPFEDLPGPDSAREDRPFATSVGLETRPVWKRALAQAEEAETLYVIATDAHKAGIRDKLNESGSEARSLFDTALTNTAAFELEVVEEFGEDDPAVARIVAERNRWFERVRWLHRTVATTVPGSGGAQGGGD